MGVVLELQCIYIYVIYPLFKITHWSSSTVNQHSRLAYEQGRSIFPIEKLENSIQICYPPPQKKKQKNGTWKSPPKWEGKSSSKPSFLGFHVGFRGVNVLECKCTSITRYPFHTTTNALSPPDPVKAHDEPSKVGYGWRELHFLRDRLGCFRSLKGCKQKAWGIRCIMVGGRV